MYHLTQVAASTRELVREYPYLKPFSESEWFVPNPFLRYRYIAEQRKCLRVHLKGMMLDMTWVELEKEARRTNTILIPVGTVEEHGPHLPLGTDTYGSLVLTGLVRKFLEKRGWKSVIAPAYPFGINHATGDFPGSMTVRQETLKMILTDICGSLKRMGFSTQFVINHHLDPVHVNALKEAIEVASSKTGADVYGISSFVGLNKMQVNLCGPKRWLFPLPKPEAAKIFKAQILDIHAGEKETSMMLCYYPEQVRSNWRKLGPMKVDLAEFHKGGKAAKEQTPLGYIGEPRFATAEKGKRDYELRAASISEAIIRILSK